MPKKPKIPKPPKAPKPPKEPSEWQIGWALHQMKRDAVYRDVVVARQDHSIVEFDAAGQEFRWMAIASEDRTMLALCRPGEDPHSFMGSQMNPEFEYRELIDIVGDKNHPRYAEAKAIRQGGKVGNLCVAGDTLILTDRGVCSIEHVRPTDLVWDGLEFVSHDGVVCSGVKPVIRYAGLTATPDHKVLTNGATWTKLEDAAIHGWRIEPSLGEGWARKCRSTLWIMDGIVRRAVREVYGSLCESALRLRHRERCEPSVHGDWQISAVQGVRRSSETSTRAEVHLRDPCRQGAAEEGQRMVPTMQQPKRSVLSQLRRTWDRMQVRVGTRGGRVGETAPAAPYVPSTGHRPHGQRWSLRAWKLALGLAQGEPGQPTQYTKVYDIVNCGPRTRFAANGLIVHNSLQYRTSPKTYYIRARVDHGMPITETEAEHGHFIYHKTYPGVRRYWSRSINRAKELGYAETFAGRRVQLVGDWTGRDKWPMESTAVNYPIQGTGADQKYLAFSTLAPHIYETGSRLLLELHDGIYFEVPDNALTEFVPTARSLLDNLPYQEAWGFTPPIPMPWDCKVGKSWGSLKEIKL